MMAEAKIIVSLMVAVIVFVPVKTEHMLPLQVNSVVLGAGNSPGSCPSSDILESARRNITSEVRRHLLNIPCGGLGWTRVTNLDLGSASQQCPSPWVEVSNPDRSCTSSFSGAGCEGISLPASGVTYSRVCGRAVGYGVNSPDGFIGPDNIDNAYLDGISVTYGSPRQHIWSFGAGHGGNFRCPCDNQDRGQAPLPPTFVGENYFCDGNYNGALWDGEDCTTNCCTFNSPPWFSVSLPTPTSDDIEVRICTDQHSGDETVHLRFLQLYVQ